MATSEGIPSSIDIEFLELNDNPYSTPRPIIVTAKEIIFPMEYNIVNRGVESTDTFNIIDNQLEP